MGACFPVRNTSRISLCIQARMLNGIDSLIFNGKSLASNHWRWTYGLPFKKMGGPHGSLVPFKIKSQTLQTICISGKHKLTLRDEALKDMTMIRRKSRKEKMTTVASRVIDRNVFTLVHGKRRCVLQTYGYHWNFLSSVDGSSATDGPRKKCSDKNVQRKGCPSWPSPKKSGTNWGHDFYFVASLLPSYSPECWTKHVCVAKKVCPTRMPRFKHPDPFPFPM
jgi:hypothetical protein